MEEATQPKVCRCLLRDMTGENDYLRSVERYRATMPRRLRTPDALYETRLACCRDCEALQNGTCMQCGCYVEMRRRPQRHALSADGAALVNKTARRKSLLRFPACRI